MLIERIERLEQRLAAIEARQGAPQPQQEPAAAVPAETAKAANGVKPPDPEFTPSGTTLNFSFDAYTGYNFNRPFTSANALRAYDVSSNSFAINQAGIVLERAPDLAAGRRYGGRLDLMFGQATETLQGSAANEKRPEVYRHIFQAYGTYVVPLGKGVTVDFGKWASSFGLENNYTKDQINYSRSFWFSFLPFYHMGFRATYPLSGKLNASYWVTNGLNQTEDFNGFKSHAVLLNYNPSGKFSANLNYYNGQEQRAVLGRAPNGRSHIVDAYFTWQPSDRWTLAAEGDYFIERIRAGAPPRLVYGGAGYLRYRIAPRFSLASRLATLNDRDAIYSGTRQSLKDATITATFDATSGFQMRWEVRRDWSDANFFAARNPGALQREQTTALLGLIWWFGGKKGVW